MKSKLDSVMVTWRFGENGPAVLGAARIAGSEFRGRISHDDLTEEDITEMIAALFGIKEILKRQNEARQK